MAHPAQPPRVNNEYGYEQFDGPDALSQVFGLSSLGTFDGSEFGSTDGSGGMCPPVTPMRLA